MHILCLSFEIQKRAERRMRLTAIIFGAYDERSVLCLFLLFLYFVSLSLFFLACENEQLKREILIYAPSSAVELGFDIVFGQADKRNEHVQHVWQAALTLSSDCLAATFCPSVS